MLIGCTRKAAKTVHKTMQEQYEKEHDLFCWHMMEFSVFGDNILLLMNVKTRFPLFLHGYDESIDIDDRLVHAFEDAMHYLRVPQKAIDAYETHGDICYTKAWDRSILAQMSELAHVYKANIEFGVHKFYSDVDATIDYSEIPCLKYNIYPKDKMHEEMMSIYGKILGV